MSHEVVNGQRIRCYDNGGVEARGGSIDRYTVVYLDWPANNGRKACVCMNGEPFHPQGFGQHGECTDGRHLGKRIALSNLPTDCRRLVEQDTKDGA